MSQHITLVLNPQELNQLLEGLSERAESWEEIAESLRDSRSGASEDGDSGVQPERGRSMEALTAGLAATRIAVRYRNILDKILDQAQACGWKA